MRLDLVFECWAEGFQTKGAYARDKDGKDVAPLDPSAVCWCAMGWMAAVRVPEEISTAFDRWIRVRHPSISGGGLADANDDRAWPPAKFNQEWKIFLGSDTFRAIAEDKISTSQLLLPTESH